VAGTAGAAPSGSGSGLSLNVTGPIPVNVPPIPLVTLPPGGSTTVAGVSVPGVLSAGVLNAASTQTGPNGAASSASVANLAALPAVAPITATAVSSSCTSDPSGTSGTSSIVNGVVLGSPVAVSPAPNSSLTVPAVGTVILNEQQTSGSQITVRAIHAIIATPLGIGANLPVATSVCDSGLNSPGSGSGSGSGSGGRAVAVGQATAAAATAANPTLAG
jgi:hypothetical protein